MVFVNMLPGAIAEGLIWGLMAIGIAPRAYSISVMLIIFDLSTKLVQGERNAKFI